MDLTRELISILPIIVIFIYLFSLSLELEFIELDLEYHNKINLKLEFI